MADIIFRADQGAGVRKIIRIMQGDAQTHVVRFVVPRHESGVDLAPLAWYIRFIDANGKPDIALPDELHEVTEDEIRVRWTIDGRYTAEAGSAQFELRGVARGRDGDVVWRSGIGELEITEGLNFELPEDMENKISALDELIIHVQGNLEGVYAARDAANEAAQLANNAANTANASAAAAEVAREAAAAAATNAQAATTSANAASEAAEQAAADANKAAQGYAGLDGKVGRLSEEIEHVTVARTGRNKYYVGNEFVGFFTDINETVDASYTDFMTTDFIDVSDLTMMTVSCVYGNREYRNKAQFRCAILYDADKNPVLYSDYNALDVERPEGVKYIRFRYTIKGAYVQTQIMVEESANFSDSLSHYEAYHEELYLDGDRLATSTYEIPPQVVNSTMTKAEFVSAFKAAMTAYGALNKCFSESFDSLMLRGTESWELIYKYINHDLRTDAASKKKDFSIVCSRINAALTKRLYRFDDAKISAYPRDSSIDTEFQADEPSAIVSEDGGKLYIYAHLKRIETTDGMKWSEPIPLVLNGGVPYIMHCNVNLIDGTYYLIGCDRTTGGGLHLYTSVDGINFGYIGVIFQSGHQFSNGRTAVSWGNTFLVKEYGNELLYLYVESADSDGEWVIDLATTSNIYQKTDAGTMGVWTNAENNPVIVKPYDATWKGGYNTAGNPDFAKGADNRPVKVDGKYYMYFHSTRAKISHVLRAYSEDLKHWESEGTILDNRDQPSGGDETSGNADQCIIEFKGRTYLFYSWDINNPDALPYIKYTVDDRPIREILSLMP